MSHYSERELINLFFRLKIGVALHRTCWTYLDNKAMPASAGIIYKIKQSGFVKLGSKNLRLLLQNKVK